MKKFEFSQNPDFQAAADFLTSRNRFAILCHLNPDGDTIGSAYALAGLLEHQGKETAVFCHDEIPAKYDYLREGLSLSCKEKSAETVVAVDTASPELLGTLRKRFERCDLLIDHHSAGIRYAALSVTDPAAASTTVLILRLCLLMGAPLTKQMANAVFTGLSTDTGCFRYSNTNIEAHLAAIHTLEAGADAYFINKRMFETKSRNEMEFTRLALDTLEYFHGGKIAVVTLTDEMRRKSGFFSEELGEIPQFTSRVEGVACGITIKQVDDLTYKISLRTGAEMSAARLAALFGGGGHTRAAGCTVSGCLEDVKAKIVRAAEGML